MVLISQMLRYGLWSEIEPYFSLALNGFLILVSAGGYIRICFSKTFLSWWIPFRWDERSSYNVCREGLQNASQTNSEQLRSNHAVIFAARIKHYFWCWLSALIGEMNHWLCSDHMFSRASEFNVYHVIRQQTILQWHSACTIHCWQARYAILIGCVPYSKYFYQNENNGKDLIKPCNSLTITRCSPIGRRITTWTLFLVLW